MPIWYCEEWGADFKLQVILPKFYLAKKNIVMNISFKFQYLLIIYFMTTCSGFAFGQSGDALDGTGRTYQEAQISEFSIEKAADGSLQILVMPMLETLYTCPGVLLGEANGAVMVKFVRCRINANCPVDARAVVDSANPGRYRISLPDMDKPIKIDYRSGAVQVWPRT
jgi:hypothetical protein